MKMKLLIFGVSAVVACASVATAQRGTSASSDSLYRRGQQLLADNDYRRAAATFKTAHDRDPRGAHAGDALFWHAWALYQADPEHNAKALLDSAASALDEQTRSYASTVTQDAKDLRVRISAAQAKLGDAGAAARVSTRARELQGSRGCPREEDDMRIVALEGLMSMDAESAVPILKEVLARRGECTEALRKRAVFIVSQKRSADVTSILLDVARKDPNPDIRGDAIQWLGQTQSETAVIALDSVLFSASDTDLRNKALFALSQSRSDRATQAMRRAADDERLPAEVRGQAVFWLGQTRRADLEFFRALFKKTKNDDIRGQIFMAVGQQRSAEGMRWLLDLARDKSVDLDSRKNAAFWAGQHGADIAALSALYDDSRGEHEMQNHVLFILSQRRETAALDKLMSVAKNDPDAELKKQAIFWLGQKNDPRARAFLLDLIKG
jgi:DNA-directed RNA polymerase subunit M/transcription elongation factor TFIIS